MLELALEMWVAEDFWEYVLTATAFGTAFGFLFI